MALYAYIEIKMKLNAIKLIIFTSVFIVVGCGDKNASSIIDRMAQTKALTDGLCSNPEELDRHLLQQTWFHTENYQNIAMVFGQYSFSYYKAAGDFEKYIKGAFCIDRKDLQIQYYETKFLPSGIEFNKGSIVTINFSDKIKPLSNDIATITKLTHKILTIKLHSHNETRTFYRKN